MVSTAGSARSVMAVLAPSLTVIPLPVRRISVFVNITNITIVCFATAMTIVTFMTRFALLYV